MVRSDRGTEFRNALMTEFCALMGTKQKFSMSMRPCENGTNERMHQEVQKTLHVIIQEIARGETDEWSELLPVAEFVLDNTPGAHGYTPRDLERSWSLGLDLEKDLVRDSLKFEPISDWARRQFSQFASLAQKVKKHWENSSAARAKLANRYRRTLDLKVGDRVVWQSPVARPSGAGRVPWKRGLTGPWEIAEVRGNRVILKNVHEPSHSSVEAHSEDCVLVPADVEDTRDNSREELFFDEGSPEDPPSLGQRLRGEGEQREFVLQRRGRQFVLRIGDVVAYTKGQKICHFGRVTQVSVEEATVGVHKYRPILGSLRVKWVLAYLNEEGTVDDNGTQPVIDQVKLKEVVTKADINRDGVLAASTSRKLDKAGYKLLEERASFLDFREEPPSAASVDMLLAALWEGSVVHGQVFTVLDQEVSRLQAWLARYGVRPAGFLEVFAGHAGLTSAARRAGVITGPPVDSAYEAYGRRWDLSRQLDRQLLDVIINWLTPLLVHFGLPFEHYCREGKGAISAENEELLSYCVSVLARQKERKSYGSLENPVGSSVFHRRSLTAAVGTLANPTEPWAFVRTDGCQYGMVSQAVDDGSQGTPVEQGQLWLSNFDLSPCSLRCRKPDALAVTVHPHRSVRGSVKVPFDDGREHWTSAGNMSGIYPTAFCDAYWKCAPRRSDRPGGEWSEGRGIQSSPASCSSSSGLRQGFPDVAAELAVPEKEIKVEVPQADVNVSAELTARERERLEKDLAEYSSKMTKYWDDRARHKDWEQVKSDLSVYRLSGQEVTEDPRRTSEYRKQVLEGLGFGDGEGRKSKRTGQDFEACQEVLARKAAAFWLEGSPRTIVRNVAHDTIPTGPPVSLQPHHLKGEAAAWVDERLEEECQRGQLVRGTSAWGSPPFPTREAPAHKRHRKRRLVVDYRRVNSRVLRSTYYCRKSSDVLAQCSGSIFYSFVDAVSGFNQIANTRRAMEVLAIVARSGKFLPICLTFGPINGPDDFCFVVDRAYGPGRGRKLRYTREWVAYVDDLTIRTGRCIDGRLLTDEEHDQEIKDAMRHTPVTVGQAPTEAMRALGVRPEGLSGQKSKHDEKESDHNHPTRERFLELVHPRTPGVGLVGRNKVICRCKVVCGTVWSKVGPRGTKAVGSRRFPPQLFGFGRRSGLRRSLGGSTYAALGARALDHESAEALAGRDCDSRPVRVTQSWLAAGIVRASRLFRAIAGKKAKGSSHGRSGQKGSHNGKGFKCSHPRPARDDSSEEDWGQPQESESATRATEAFLKVKKELRLRGKRKRGGTRHKRKTTKRKRAAAGPAFRGSRAARPKRSKKEAAKRGSLWARSRKGRNKAAHAAHGNGWSQVAGVFCCFLAVPVLRETEEIVGAASDAVQEAISSTSDTIQEVIVESGYQLRGAVAVFGIAIQGLCILAVWYLGHKLRNFWCRFSHGNTDPRLVNFDGNSSVWEVKGSKEVHRVRISGSGSGCACRAFLSTGKCGHLRIAQEAHKKLAGTSSVEGGSSSASRAAARGRTAIGAGAMPASFGSVSADLGFGGCFQGLVDKAKSLKEAVKSAPPTVLNKDSAAYKEKVVRESLSLDTGVDEGSGLLALPSSVQIKGNEDQARVQFLKDGESFEWVANVFNSLGRGCKAYVRAYSFDQPGVVEGLKAASTRGCDCYLVCDRAQAAGRTKQQLQVLKELKSSGAKVRLTSGLGVNEAYRSDGRAVRVGAKLQGLHHAKSILVHCHPGDEVKILIGSCNFTTSSKANREASIGLTTKQGTELVRHWESAFEEVFESGSSIDQFEADQGDSNRRRVGASRSTAEVQ